MWTNFGLKNVAIDLLKKTLCQTFSNRLLFVWITVWLETKWSQAVQWSCANDVWRTLYVIFGHVWCYVSSICQIIIIGIQFSSLYLLFHSLVSFCQEFNISIVIKICRQSGEIKVEIEEKTECKTLLISYNNGLWTCWGYLNETISLSVQLNIIAEYVQHIEYWSTAWCDDEKNTRSEDSCANHKPSLKLRLCLLRLVPVSLYSFFFFFFLVEQICLMTWYLLIDARGVKVTCAQSWTHRFERFHKIMTKLRFPINLVRWEHDGKVRSC